MNHFIIMCHYLVCATPVTVNSPLAGPLYVLLSTFDCNNIISYHIIMPYMHYNYYQKIQNEKDQKWKNPLNNTWVWNFEITKYFLSFWKAYLYFFCAQEFPSKLIPFHKTCPSSISQWKAETVKNWFSENFWLTRMSDICSIPRSESWDLIIITPRKIISPVQWGKKYQIKPG